MRALRWGLVGLVMIVSSFSGEGRLTARSSQIVRLQLVVDTTPVTLSERDGGTARIDIRGQQILGMTPTLDSGVANGLNLAIVQITVSPSTGEETLQELGHVELKVGQTVRFDGAVAPVEIKFVGISAAGAQPPAPNGPCQKCCVICDGIATCACAVETACGNCCCPECCVYGSAPGALCVAQTQTPKGRRLRASDAAQVYARPRAY